MLLMPALKKRLEKETAVGNLPTLEGILRDLGAYTKDPKATVSQISEHISRDPSLSVRLLRLANSSYYARAEPIMGIDEAVLFLGLGQIRILSLTTRCVELMSPQDKQGFSWTDFWRHCIATAHFSSVLGKFIVRDANSPELDYMGGLLHDVGKLVIAMLSPEGFGYLLGKARAESISFHQAEKNYFDTDHAALGGWYLERQSLPSAVFEAVRCHHSWTTSVKNQEVAAIINISDFLARQCNVGCSGNFEAVEGTFDQTPAWTFLLEHFQLKQDPIWIIDKVAEECERIEGLVDSLLPATQPAAPSPIVGGEIPSSSVKPKLEDGQSGDHI